MLEIDPLAPPRPAQGGVLAFDFGAARVGVATGDFSIQLATPLTTIAASETEPRFNAISDLIAEWQPVWLVVGLPAFPNHSAGTEAIHPMVASVQKFARRLHGRFHLPVTLIDETYTSSIAAHQLRAQGIHGKSQGRKDNKGKLDQLAAQQILQAFFDESPPC